MYLPALTNARPVSRYIQGDYLVIVLTDCESVGAIAYKHVILVYKIEHNHEDDKDNMPVLAVASEVNQSITSQTPDEYDTACFLGVFPGNGHINMGLSKDWADLETFTKKALDVIADHLNIDQPPFLIPNHGGQSPVD